MVGERDPYAALVGKPIAVVMRNGDKYAGILIDKSYSMATLQIADGETCVVRREDVSVIRSTVRPDPPSGATLRTHGQTEVRTVIG